MHGMMKFQCINFNVSFTKHRLSRFGTIHSCFHLTIYNFYRNNTDSAMEIVEQFGGGGDFWYRA